jgi:transcriptional regulator with XRE-family HTH domain
MTKQGGWPRSGFGDRLRALRESRGLTQPQLAERAGCNRFTVAKLERGAQEPAWPLVLALAGALGVEVGAFVVANGQPAPQEMRPRGRPRKAPGAAQETPAASKATPAPSGQEKPTTGQGRKRKGSK